VGITKAERHGYLSHLLSEVPAAVVAKATGYGSATTAAREAQAGTNWARYVALKRAPARLERGLRRPRLISSRNLRCREYAADRLCGVTGSPWIRRATDATRKVA
jgi:hypothetical protein